MKTSHQQDALKRLFVQLPKDKLPETFRQSMMQQIMAEAMRVKKRNERLVMGAIIAASVVMLALGVLVFVYMDVPEPVVEWPKMPKMPSLTAAPLSVFVGALSLLLLFGDYQMRKIYKRRHKE